MGVGAAAGGVPVMCLCMWVVSLVLWWFNGSFFGGFRPLQAQHFLDLGTSVLESSSTTFGSRAPFGSLSLDHFGV